MSFLKFGAKLLRFFFPSDAENRAGYGPFSLPDGHPFHRAGAVHDFYFEEAKKGKTEIDLDFADLKLIQMFYALANNAQTIHDKLALMEDLCAYWPVARKVGKFIWQGEKENL